MDDELLTVAEIAGELRKSEQTVRQWIREGRLPEFQAGLRGYRVYRSDLEQMVSYLPGKHGPGDQLHGVEAPDPEPAKFTEEDLGAELLARTRTPDE